MRVHWIVELHVHPWISPRKIQVILLEVPYCYSLLVSCCCHIIMANLGGPSPLASIQIKIIQLVWELIPRKLGTGFLLWKPQKPPVSLNQTLPKLTVIIGGRQSFACHRLMHIWLQRGRRVFCIKCLPCKKNEAHSNRNIYHLEVWNHIGVNWTNGGISPWISPEENLVLRDGNHLSIKRFGSIHIFIDFLHEMLDFTI